MMNCLFGMLNGWEIALIFVAFFLIFGVKKLPAMAKSLGQSIKEFKNEFEQKTEPPAAVRKANEG